MILNNKTSEGWKELYPKTLANNVELNNGKTIQNIVDDYEPSVRFGDGYSETEGKPTIILRDRMFITSFNATLSTMVQNKYLRNHFTLPFSNVESYTVNFTLVGPNSQTRYIYVREKNKDTFQLSTEALASYEEGYTANVDVQVIGVLEV